MPALQATCRRGNLTAAEELGLLRRWHECSDREARELLVERMLPFVRHVARGYAGRGELVEDLVQVGVIGLINAIDRFDISRGLRLSTFAAPNISGEIKRHFRDRTWAVRVPRDLQELGAKVSRLTAQLTTTLGRAPTVAELAEHLGEEEEHVLDAIEAGRSFVAASLDEPLDEHDADRGPRSLGELDGGFARAEDRALLERGLRSLPERERRIVVLRFAEGLTQREIAQRVGISQMHVSRLLRRSIDRLRQVIAADVARPDVPADSA
ncbi:MAG: SigB/SigF/SigG family RNA polymerase sigma factor [Solirubrobacteraceae bacterium]|nr:SigB/SigF/SigG family RNA polymerase sigma factor [Solirubrobacteraceae bacterium]